MCRRSSGTWATPARIASRASPPRSRLPATETDAAGGGPHAGERLGELALAVAGHAGDREDLAGTDRRWTHRAARRRRDRRRRTDLVDLEHRLAELAVALDALRDATSRPTISAASERGVASAVSTVATVLPARSTVTRSETAFTSCSLCEMKMIVRPSSAITPQRLEQRIGLLRGQHRRRLVEDQHARVAVERLQDLDPLLLAQRQLPDPGARVDRDAGSARPARRRAARSGAG